MSKFDSIRSIFLAYILYLSEAMRKTWSKFMIILFSLVGVWQAQADDQAYIRPDQYRTVNPRPFERRFEVNNRNHQVIVAVIGTGVDYNSPFLSDNIHFQLNQDNEPLGFGWDFIGNDPWPAPYLAATMINNPEASSDFVGDSTRVRNRLNQIIQGTPELAEMLNPDRAIELEGSEDFSISHETEVTSLITQGDPRIGIVGYRCQPPTLKFKDHVIVNQIDRQIELAIKCLEAVKKAVDDGANIINLSMLTEIPPELSQIQYLLDEGRALIRDNPQILFVMGAGNSSRVIFKNTYPYTLCGSDLPNVLCVGGLDDNKKLASFSTVFPDVANFLLAPATNLTAIRPTLSCVGSYSLDLRWSSIWNSPIKQRKLIDDIKNDCLNSDDRVLVSGTSYATPLVTKRAATLFLDHGKTHGSEIAESIIKEAKVKNFSRNSELHSFDLNYLDVEKPLPSIFEIRSP